jgi:isopenicillin N synthase-like dioxygenase
MTIPILDLGAALDPRRRQGLLNELRQALFDVGFLYITNHGVPQNTISNLTEQLPALFDLPNPVKSKLSMINSPHFLGYSGYAEETTQGKRDLREQFDYATELPVIYGQEELSSRDFSKLFWRLRGPNQWPTEEDLPGFRKAVLA